jgi:uncharacterized protein (TIGR04141 family)
LGFNSIAFLQSDRKKQPTWVSFVNQYFTLDNIQNVTNSLILLIEITAYNKKHFFAVVGGQGHFYLNKAKLQSDFGLRVVLNTINPSKIGIFDSKNFNANQKQQRITFSKGNSVQEFGFDENEELLSLMSGKPLDKEFATRISGADSLHIASDLSFKDLGGKCKYLLKQFRSNEYKKTFPFVDKFKPIEDATLIAELTDKLKDYIVAKDTQLISLSFPTITDLDIAHSYEYRVGSTNMTDSEFTIEKVYELITTDTPSVITADYLSKIGIITFDGSGHFANGFQFLDIVTFELNNYKGNSFILTNSHWYKIDKKYIAQIDKDFDNIEIITTTTYLPEINKGESEGSYNGRLDKTNYCIYDKKLFTGPTSTSKVEVCDAFHKTDKHLICVKKLNGSATLSHLFAQGSVSVTLLAEYDKYRKYFCTKTNSHFKTKEFNDKTLNVSDYKLVYAIASGRKGDLKNIIPFFSKINLLTHIKAIKIRGAKAALYKIEEV